jgi:O-antigen/teichoic acid export membrane protein
MGAYTLGSDIAAIPSTELISPLSRVLFPVFVNVKDDKKKLKETFLLALGIQAFIGMPAGAGLAMVAEELVLTLLGEKWSLAIPFIQVMGAINIVSAIGNSGGYLLLALGRARVTATAIWLQILLFGGLVVLAIPEGAAMEVAWLRLVVAICGLSVFFVVIRGELAALRVSEILQAIWRPLLASALMAGVLLSVDLQGGVGIGLQLLLKVTIGAATYGMVGLALWRLAGCPAGPEAYLLEKLKLDATVGRWVRGDRRLRGE